MIKQYGIRIYRYILLLITLTSVIENASGTGQIPDFLIDNGDTLSIFANPLESYFETSPRPDSIFDEYGHNSTACWRGYIGYWELKNDSLFLLELQGESSTIDLALIFKDRNTDTKIFADWVSFPILNPYGKLIHYEHMGYASIYEFEREFIFSNGILTGLKKYDNSKSRKSKYTQDQQLLKEFIRSNTNNALLPDSVDKAKVFVKICKVTPEGRIESVAVIRGYDKKLDQEAVRIVKSIPEWDVIYHHGEPINLQWIIPVFFEKEE